MILKGAMQNVVGKGRDEQRNSFSNFLDNIAGQARQSSPQSLRLLRLLSSRRQRRRVGAGYCTQLIRSKHIPKLIISLNGITC